MVEGSLRACCSTETAFSQKVDYTRTTDNDPTDVRLIARSVRAATVRTARMCRSTTGSASTPIVVPVSR
ncbi:hypothetical protein ZHAS_00021471 [Anopheles sinensis]|uniref:Uncharacterized protein n=1 Tax=Anopheles sinensis TaxID=74873 RepID=A0A084WSE3_ANOSI|nr:hypothetical protein ZHAS_00021471 [Anopheles sinensis]